ncbi:MAG: hypothetical protein AB7L13_22460 [Acidimicrobiia bacterium]
MLARRLLALALAIALVGAAVVARSKLDNGGTTADVADSGDLRLGCISELANVCAAVAAALPAVSVTTEAAGRTIDRLADRSRSVDLDGWLTFSPLPDAAGDERGEQVFERSTPLGRSELGIAVRGDRQAVLAAKCPGLVWKCVGDLANRPWSQIGGRAEWGNVKPGFDDPTVSARGLLVFTAAVVSWFGNPDLGKRELSDNGFRSWLRNVRDANPTDTGALDSSLVRMITQPGSLDLVGTSEADWAALGSRADFPLVAANTGPVGSLSVVLATTFGKNATKLENAVRNELVKQLTAAGWTPTGASNAISDVDGTTVNAIRNLWREQS